MNPQTLGNSDLPRVVTPSKEDLEWAAKERKKTETAIKAAMLAERDEKYPKTQEFATKAYLELVGTRVGKLHSALIVMKAIKQSLENKKIFFHDDYDATKNAMSRGMEDNGEIWINTGFYGNPQGTMLELLHEGSHAATEYGMRPWKYSTDSGSLDEQEAYSLQLSLYVELKEKYPSYSDNDMERLLKDHPEMVKAKAADKWQNQGR